MSHKVTIPIGPYHSLQEEPEFYQLTVDGETVIDIDVRIGYVHRGIEKLAESMSYHKIIFLVERICGICSTSHPIASVQAIEDAGGIEVPDRALYIRTIVAELERLHSHMLWLGLAGHFLGYNTVWMWAWKYREIVCDLFEAITGSRQSFAMMKVGGVQRDIEDEYIPGLIKGMDDTLRALDMFKGAVLDDPVLGARLKGIGILSKEDALSYSALGPTSRASGVDKDVRRDDPYAAYDRVKWNVITQKEGDVFAKAVIRILEMYESVSIIKQCVQKMPKGSIDSNPKEIPPGEGIGHAEAPRGEVFHYIRSDGTNSPARYKVRAPTYMNFPTFKATVIGETISDATIILAAIDPCYCCTERKMTAVNQKTRKRSFTGDDMIKLSQEKTRRLYKRMTGKELR